MHRNPKLQALAVLVGEWTTVGTHPILLGKTFHGHATFNWLESGAFLIFHSHIDESEIPDGVAIVGADDATPDAPGFSQRMVLTIAEDGQSIAAKGEMSRNDQTWEPDLELSYSRVS